MSWRALLCVLVTGWLLPPGAAVMSLEARTAAVVDRRIVVEIRGHEPSSCGLDPAPMIVIDPDGGAFAALTAELRVGDPGALRATLQQLRPEPFPDGERRVRVALASGTVADLVAVLDATASAGFDDPIVMEPEEMRRLVPR